jgi:hypothetical protein
MRSDVSTATGIKAIGSWQFWPINVQLVMMGNLFPSHCLYVPIRFRSTIRTPCVCQLSIKIQEWSAIACMSHVVKSRIRVRGGGSRSSCSWGFCVKPHNPSFISKSPRSLPVAGVILCILTLWPTDPKMSPKRYTTQSWTCEADDLTWQVCKWSPQTSWSKALQAHRWEGPIVPELAHWEWSKTWGAKPPKVEEGTDRRWYDV